MQEITQADRLKIARNRFGLTQEESGQLVGVSSRTWIKWEMGNAQIPKAAYELFMLKVSGNLSKIQEYKDSIETEVVAVFGGDEINLYPIDVVGSSNFLSIEYCDDNQNAVIHSFATLATGPRRYSTKFSIIRNSHVIKAAERWAKSAKSN